MINKIINGRFFSFNPQNGQITAKPLPMLKNKPAKRRLKVGVIIDTALSIPPTTGVTYRLYYLSRALARQGYEQVWFVGNRNFATKKSLTRLKNPHIKIHLLPPKLFYQPQILNSLIKKEKIGLLQYEISQTFLFLGVPLKRLNGLPAVLENHDIEASLRETLGLGGEIDLAKFIQFTANTLADAATVMTPMDKKMLIEDLHLPAEKIFLAPNGIADDFPYRGLNKKENILLFLGNMYYPPNREAVMYLIEKVMPAIKKEIPNARLKAVGLTPKKIKTKYKKRTDVIFTGELKTETEFNQALASGTIGLATVFAGSGMKVKILNYAASGLPIIATPLGLSGYEKIKSLVAAKPTAKSIAAAAVKLLKNKRQAEKLGKINRQTILKEFSWRQITKTVGQAYQLAENLNKAQGRVKINIPRPFWLKEKRQAKKVLNKHYIINKEKIYGANKK